MRGLWLRCDGPENGQLEVEGELKRRDTNVAVFAYVYRSVDGHVGK